MWMAGFGGLLIVAGILAGIAIAVVPAAMNLSRSATVYAVTSGVGLMVLAWLLAAHGTWAAILIGLTYLGVAVAFLWGYLHNRKINGASS